MKKLSLMLILFATIVIVFTGCEGDANETKQSEAEAARDVVDDPYVGDEPEFHEQVLDVPDPEDAVKPEEQPDLIVEQDMFIMAEMVADCEWTGTEFYCYYFVGDGELHFWSPTNDCYVASNVNYVRTTNKHTFYESKDGDIYVLNADPFAIMRASADYVYAHPVPVVCLGKGPMSVYSDRLISYGEADFDHYYGLNPSAWGN